MKSFAGQYLKGSEQSGKFIPYIAGTNMWLGNWIPAETVPSCAEIAEGKERLMAQAASGLPWELITCGNSPDIFVSRKKCNPEQIKLLEECALEGIVKPFIPNLSVKLGALVSYISNRPEEEQKMFLQAASELMEPKKSRDLTQENLMQYPNIIIERLKHYIKEEYDDTPRLPDFLRDLNKKMGNQQVLNDFKIVPETYKFEQPLAKKAVALTGNRMWIALAGGADPDVATGLRSA